MVNFSLGKQFDAVTCLFSAIGYAKTTGKLNQTVQSIARHLRPGGVALIEPWLLPEQFNTNHIGAVFVDQPALKISRMNTSSIADGVSTLHFHYMVGTPEGITHFTEDHELGLFTDADYRAALASAGLETHFYAHGLDGRGMYIGVKPA
jgi:SAM-dependent methyltransferase